MRVEELSVLSERDPESMLQKIARRIREGEATFTLLLHFPLEMLCFGERILLCSYQCLGFLLIKEGLTMLGGVVIHTNN